MSVENSESADGSEIEAKAVNGTQDQRLNGLSNGHIETSSSKHKSSSKDKYRDKDYKSSKSSSSSTRDKESSDKHKSSSSSSKDKYRDKDRDKEKDKDREKDKERDKDKDRDKEKHKSSSSHKSSTRDKERDREKDRDKEKERSKDKDRDRDRDREKDRDKDKHRDKDKERSKEKSDRDHEKRDRESDKERKKEHKSSSDKDRKDRDREKEKSESSSKEKDRDRHKSSKDKHSSSSRSKDKDRDNDKYSSSRDKDRSKDKEKRNKEDPSQNGGNEIKEQSDEDVKDIKKEIEFPRNDYDQSCSGFSSVKEETNIKTENEKYGYEIKPVFKEESNFNISQASSCDYSMSQFRDDEPAFDIKAEMTDDSQDNVENEAMEESVQDEEMQEAPEEDDDDDVPLAKRKATVVGEESDDDVPLVSRKKQKTEKVEKKEKKVKRKKKEADDDFLDEKPKKKKVKKEKAETVITESPTKGRKKKAEEESQEVWRWWEEEKREDGVKWTYLEHKGPVFAPDYEPLPSNVKFYYDGKEMRLSQDAEEIACFYAKMLNHDYVTKKVFNDNFFKDWRRSMTSKEKDIIRDIHKCNFKEMHDYFQALSEKNKNRSKEEKLAMKEAQEKLIQEYGFCIIDGHKEKIGNFKLEPPGLFRGRGEHPKMGLVKRRIMPEDVSINCSKDSKIPEPPKGHRWKEVRHDNTVTWLASWVENVQGQVKYIMLNPSSKLKGEKDFQKYETARRLDKHIDKIRATYREEWKSKEMRIRQRGVALYFIDRLALRAGNEKDEDQADTVGCCSLRVEHVKLYKELNGKENVVVFDFLGKDSIRYYNEVEVEKRVFKNLELFMENKKEGDDLFDRLNTLVLNEHLRELMEGLTAKVFRTYNASITLQNQLDLLTDPDSSIPEKLLAYNRANRAVAVLCNHQRSIPKSHAKSMENLKEKIRQKREAIDDAQAELKDLQRQAKRGSVKERLNADKKAKQLEKLKEQLKKLELQETDKDENKTIALGTSKLNYLDPRISVAWCKKYNVPIEKIFNKTQRDKFRWAIHMADEDYRF